MTVAIAALCQAQGLPAIIAAADHMITAGDVEFEQPQPKMWHLGPHAVAMIYGDGAAQAEVAARTGIGVVQNGIRDLGQIASLYGSHLTSYVRRSAEAAILAPLALTTDSFFASHPGMHPDLVDKLTRQLQDYFYDSGISRILGGAIIVGADQAGGHIWQVEYGQQTQLDRIGFAAAGSGQRHAESEFMFARYTQDWDFSEALALVYAAKKRAEVAPGVGLESDIVFVFTNPPNISHHRNDGPLVEHLGQIYAKWEAKRAEATAARLKEVRDYVTENCQRGAKCSLTRRRL